MGSLTAITTAEPAMLGFLQRAISDEAFDVNKFEVVLAAVREEQAKHAEREFYRAMSAAQGEMEPIRKDAQNPHTNSKYARFEAIDGHLRPIYTKHGFSVSYRTGAPSRPGAVRMICTVAHDAGHNVQAELEAALDGSGTGGRNNKTDVQATGSTVSYLRRYLLNMVFNVALASEDDDGEGSRAGHQQPRRAAAQSAQQPTPARAEMDRVLGGDDIPQFDPAADYIAKLEARLHACQAIEDSNAIVGSDGVKNNLEKMREKRPELWKRAQDAITAAVDRIHAATQASPVPAAPVEDDTEIPELDT